MIIYILDRNEKIVGFLENNSSEGRENIYFDDLYTQELSTGAEAYAFSSFCNKEVSNYLSAGNFIAFKEKDYFTLMQIIETEEEKEEVLTKHIYAETVGLELAHSIYNGGNMPNVNIKRFLENVLQDTNWKIGHIDSSLTTSLALDVEIQEVYSLIQEKIPLFGAELRFRVEIKNNRVVGRYIDVFEERGRNTGKRLEIHKDITKISRKVNLSNYATKLIGIGKDNLTFKDVEVSEIDKPIGEDFIINKEAFETLNDKGNHITKIFEFDTQDPRELLRQTKKALDEMSKPQITYEVDTNLLDFSDIELGDTIRISDLSFNPPLTISARIGKLEISKSDFTKNKATLTNFKEIKSKLTTGSSARGKVSFDDFDTDLQNKVNVIENTGISNNNTITDWTYPNKNTINGQKLEFNSITADKIDVTNLAVHGELLTGQINGVGGIKFADGAIISRIASGVANVYGIQISAPVINLESRVDITNATFYNEVKGYKSKYDTTATTWLISSDGDLSCNSLISKGIIKGKNNILLNNDSILLPNFTSNIITDYLKMGTTTLAGTDTGAFHFIKDGAATNISIANGNISLAHNNNQDTLCDYIRLGNAIIAAPNSGSVHIQKADASRTDLYVGNVFNTYSLNKTTRCTRSVFEDINKISVVETEEGLKLSESNTENNDLKENEVSIDLNLAIATLWKATQELNQEKQELKKENEDLKNRLKLIEEKLGI